MFAINPSIWFPPRVLASAPLALYPPPPAIHPEHWIGILPELAMLLTLTIFGCLSLASEPYSWMLRKILAIIYVDFRRSVSLLGNFFSQSALDVLRLKSYHHDSTICSECLKDRSLSSCHHVLLQCFRILCSCCWSSCSHSASWRDLPDPPLSLHDFTEVIG